MSTSLRRKQRTTRQHSYQVLEPRQLLAAMPIISEFVASNSSGIVDGNGNQSDWIELYNSGDASVNLLGYSLTDNAGVPNKWTFESSTVLDPQEYLVVFASGDGTPDPAGNLHTNFALAAGGEYLALSDPLGTILSEFGSSTTDYPALEEDEAYGLAFNSSFNEVATPTSTSRYFIPGSDDSVDSIWTGNGFDDSSWQMGTASIGYETTPADFDDLIITEVPAGTTSVYIRIQFDVSDPNTLLDTLQMKFDDGFIAYINGTQIVSVNAPAIVAHDSLATGQHGDAQAVNYVDFDISEYSDDLVVGTNTLSIHLLNRNSGSSDFLSVSNLITTMGDLLTPIAEGHLISPTPGKPNTNIAASAVDFSRVGGAFLNPFQLALTSSGQNETIRYTTDGSQPTANSLVYSAPITLTASTQIRARAFGSSGQVGPVSVESYSRTDSNTHNFTSDLPIVVIENYGLGVPGDGDFEDGSLSIYEVNDITGRSSLASTADVSTVIGQHRRGSSTLNNPKPNLRVETRDAYGEDKNVSLAGLPSESDWILTGPYRFDRALIRDSLLHDLSNQIGRYSVRTKFVEVYGNFDGDTLTNNDYLGVYVLMENIKIDDDRVDIAKLDPSDIAEPDITGGYIIKIDRGGGWETSRGVPNRGGANFVHVSPEPVDLNAEQTNYIRGYVQDLEDALYGPNATDPELGYAAWLDVEASIDHHIIRTLSLEPDSLGLSTFLTKDRGGKLAFGPLWDFDRSMGSDGDLRSSDPEAWFSGVDFFEFDWWGELFKDANFKQQWVDRWQELRLTTFSDANILATLNGQAAELVEAQARNFARWPENSPNGGPFAEPGLTGWEAEVSHLAGWLMARVSWIDQQLIAAPALGTNPGNISAGSQVTLVSNQTGGDIYYTLDGSDPRAEGGGVSPTAMLYTGPLTVNETTQITARAFGAPVETIGQTPGTSPWSDTVIGVYSVGVPASPADLRITELHFNPEDPSAAEIAAGFGDNDDFEFIEIYNPSTTGTINLSGVQLSDGVTFDFGDIDLLPGARAVVVEDVDAFMERYGDSANVLGQWSGSLNNGGEEVTLIDSSFNEIMSVSYRDNDPWHDVTDGHGFSLVLKDPANTPEDELGKYYSWRSSTLFGGTPGEASIDPSGVIVNEVLAHTDLPQVDSIELLNTSGAPVNVGGWFLSDDADDLFKYSIPAGTVIAAGGYLVFDESDFNVSSTGFALDGAAGDEVYLSQNISGVPVILQDAVEFGATFNGESLGRLPNGTGRLIRLASTSLGSANGVAEVGPLVISEVQYHPGNPSSTALAIEPLLIDNDLEYVEIANPTSANVDLTNWRLRGEADFDFAAGTILPAGEAIVVVSFNSTVETAKLAAFGAHYGISAGVTIVGGLSASLSNSSGRISLQQPDAPDLLGEIPNVVVDEVVYDDLLPWPDADGTGQSLERDMLDANGNFVTSWVSAAPTPGAYQSQFLLGDVNLDGIVNFLDINPFIAVLSGTTYQAEADADENGVVDFLDIAEFIAILSSQ